MPIKKMNVEVQLIKSYKFLVGELIHLEDFLTCFCDFLFAFLHITAILKRGLLKK